MTIQEQTPSLLNDRADAGIAHFVPSRLRWPAAALVILGTAILFWLGIAAIIRSLG